MKKIFNSRFFSIVILLMVVTVLFSSCMGSNGDTTVKKDAKIVETGVYSIPYEQLHSITTTIYNNNTARNEFIAAYRGYDVVGQANLNDKEYPQLEEIHLGAAEKVIEKYTDVIITDDKPLTKDDVISIVNGMQDEVNLDESRDLLASIQLGIGKVLGWITNTLGFGNYLVGICIFAIVIEILMLPFAIKQQKNSIKQANLRPKEMAIRNRYKGRNDQATQQKVTQEIQELYQRENFNPMSGCLPMLIQLPIIMLLYNIVVDPLYNVLGSGAGLSSALQVYATTSKAAGGLGLSIASSSGTIEILSQIGNLDLSSLNDFAFFSNSGEVFESYVHVAGNLPIFLIQRDNETRVVGLRIFAHIDPCEADTERLF